MALGCTLGAIGGSGAGVETVTVGTGLAYVWDRRSRSAVDGRGGSGYVAKRRDLGAGVGVDGERKERVGNSRRGLGKGTADGRSEVKGAGVDGLLASARIRESKLGELDSGDGTGGVETLGPARETGVGKAPGTGPDDEEAEVDRGRKQPWSSRGGSDCFFFFVAVVGKQREEKLSTGEGVI
ncbi:hypothetical protein RhiLY_06875 [Ceratobasidium sp. AG-Ba]|nr:hypothetical protein RhiLY_06875 [Ceratobasidium sp. AG-Ba]